MITFEIGLFILVGIILIFYSARKTALQRTKIKNRINLEYEQEIELSTDELESRLSDAELMYEDLEESYWEHTGFLVALATYFYWHIWYLSLVIGIGLIIVGRIYLSLKPFTTNMPDR